MFETKAALDVRLWSHRRHFQAKQVSVGQHSEFELKKNRCGGKEPPEKLINCLYHGHLSALTNLKLLINYQERQLRDAGVNYLSVLY